MSSTAIAGAVPIQNRGQAGANEPTAGGVAASGNGGGADRPATFTRVWNEVLMLKGCTGDYCHGSGQGMLTMGSKDEAYKNLVGVEAAGPSCGSSGKLRVKPGDPAASLLIEKLSQAAPSCGDRMPIGAKLAPNCVSQAPTVCNASSEISLVRDWIQTGAMND